MLSAFFCRTYNQILQTFWQGLCPKIAKIHLIRAGQIESWFTEPGTLACLDRRQTMLLLSCLLWNKLFLLVVASYLVYGSRMITEFTPGTGCGITKEIKVILSKGKEEKEGDRPCTLKMYLDESEIGLFGAEDYSAIFLFNPIIDFPNK